MKYIDSEKLIAEIERRRLSNRYIDTDGYENELLEIITSLQQEQPDGYNLAMIEVKAKVDELYDETSIGLSEYDAGLYNGIAETCMKLRGFIKARTSKEQPKVDLKTGIELIAAERKRQIEVEGWSKEHDAEHASESLALAAVCYAMPNVLRVYSYDPTTAQRIPEYWPWDRNSWKPSPENRIKELVKAGALIAAEIDKLNARKEQPEGGCSEKPNNLLSKM